MQRLVLASQSTSRLSILRSAGFAPEVMVSGVDENIVAPNTESMVLELACRKARAVSAICDDAFVLGCDSLLDVGGVAHGKPASIDLARKGWRAMRGTTATLMTGHCLINTATGVEASAVIATSVTFGHPSDEELEIYLSTGESLLTAGGFTLEGHSAPFVTRVEGDALNVMGVSPACVAELLVLVGGALSDCWPQPFA